MSDKQDELRARLEGMYDRFAERTRELYHQGHGRGREALDAAMEKAREQLAAAGEFTVEQGEQFKAYLRRDLDQTAGHLRDLGDAARERLDPQRLRVGALASLAAILDAAGEALQAWSRRAREATAFEAGDITSAGTLTCVKCGHAIALMKSSHIPPCPKCYGARFTKSF